MDDMESLRRLGHPPLAEAPPLDDIRSRARKQRRARQRSQAFAAVACAGLVLVLGSRVLQWRNQPDVLLGPAPTSESAPATDATALPTTPPTATSTDRPTERPTEPPTSPALGTIAPEELADVVVEAGADWFRYSAGERESLPLRFSPLGEWRLLSSGDIVYQQDPETPKRSAPLAPTPIMVLRPGQDQSQVLVDAPAESGRYITLIGTGRIDGRAVALVADGTANGLTEDEGTDIVAVDAGTGDRTMLLENAASAWEGGVSLASVEGRWLVYSSFSVTTGTVMAMDRSTGAQEKLRDMDLDGGPIDYPDLHVLRGAREPTVLLLAHHRASHPKEPAAELEMVPLEGARKHTLLPVPGISWKEGLPWSLSVSHRYMVVNRQEEQAGPAAALAYDIGAARWHELSRPAFIAMQWGDFDGGG